MTGLPETMTHPQREDADSRIDQPTISPALAHLGIAPLDRFLSEVSELTYPVPPRLDGKNTDAQIRLPLGLTTEMVTTQRQTLAANVDRAALETWPAHDRPESLLRIIQ
jgi:DNA segregation ATPase FtsK/SpoIIIE, S-DNA-T family